ncbi:DUF4365 domain-containing protein [Prolixibacteraceae bacterium]|nr:DUF4365 domain-containing protein [Prolixibacteraceae bacterium]
MKHLISNSEERKGILSMKRIISKSGRIFREIEREKDKGIDIIVEETNDDGEGMGKFVSFQIKSGKSFFTPSTQLCSITIDNHRDYWEQHPMPVYGAVFVPLLTKAYVVNIKGRLHNTSKGTISFYITDPDVYEFDYDTLKAIMHNEIIKRPYVDVFLDFINNQNFKPLYTLINHFSESYNSIVHVLNNNPNFEGFISGIGIKLNDQKYLDTLKNSGKRVATCAIKNGTFSFCENYLELHKKELEFYKMTYTNARNYLQKYGK